MWCRVPTDPIRSEPTRPDPTRPTDRPTDPTRPDPTDRDFLTFVFDSVVEPHNCRAQPANRPCSVQLHRFQPPKGFTSTLLLAREKHPRLTPLSTPFPRARVSVNSSVFSPRRTSVSFRPRSLASSILSAWKNISRVSQILSLRPWIVNIRAFVVRRGRWKFSFGRGRKKVDEESFFERRRFLLFLLGRIKRYASRATYRARIRTRHVTSHQESPSTRLSIGCLFVS